MSAINVSEILSDLTRDDAFKDISSDKSAMLELVVAKAVAFKLPLIAEESESPDAAFLKVKQKAITLISSFCEKHYIDCINVLELTKAMWCARFALVYNPELVSTIDLAQYASMAFNQRVPPSYKNLKMPHHSALYSAVKGMING